MRLIVNMTYKLTDTSFMVPETSYVKLSQDDRVALVAIYKSKGNNWERHLKLSSEADLKELLKVNAVKINYMKEYINECRKKEAGKQTGERILRS